jgi:hypothetical protein
LSSSAWEQPFYLRAKPKLHVLILGCYKSSAVKHLERLRDFLRENEYLIACLVKDFNYPRKLPTESDPSYNLRKSEHWIPESDIPIFVFLSKVDNTGVGYELKHLLDNFSDMAWRSIVCIDTSLGLKISSLLKGLIQRWSPSIQIIYFADDMELQSGSRGALTNLLERLLQRVIERKDGKWEMYVDIT